MSLQPATRDRIVALAKKGIRPGRIFDLVGDVSNLTQVYKTIGEARRQDPSIPRFKALLVENGASRDVLRVPVPVQILSGLAPHAEKRGLSAKELAVALLTTLVRDDLVDATLDDGGAP